MNPKVDEYFSTVTRWQEEMQTLRSIVLECGLTEALKWRAPCYTFTHEGKTSNVLMIGDFKDFCCISFFKGELINDPNQLLQKPGENSQSAKLARFTNTEEILKNEQILKSYIHQAIEIEKSGLKPDFKAKNEPQLIDELIEKFEADPDFQKAFEALTPGKQRGYHLYFSGAKQSASRSSRIEKYRDRILNGKGIHDCVCGHSKKYPRCDGSHKHYQ